MILHTILKIESCDLKVKSQNQISIKVSLLSSIKGLVGKGAKLVAP
jgi:hypothetical protein